jgi:hypothetical protein
VGYGLVSAAYLPYLHSGGDACRLSPCKRGTLKMKMQIQHVKAKPYFRKQHGRWEKWEAANSLPITIGWCDD